MIEALCVPEICSPVANQRLKSAKNSDECVHFCEKYDLSIGILICIDFDFPFFTSKKIESRIGVVANESSLDGY